MNSLPTLRSEFFLVVVVLLSRIASIFLIEDEDELRLNFLIEEEEDEEKKCLSLVLDRSTPFRIELGLRFFECSIRTLSLVASEKLYSTISGFRNRRSCSGQWTTDTPKSVSS